MAKTTTLKQARKILEIFEDASVEQMQAILESGLLTDLRLADIWGIDRNKFRGLCALPPLESENGAGAKKVHNFKIWKTIKLGTGLRTANDFRKALKKANCKISERANEILGKSAFTAATEETEVDLVAVSVAELSFPGGATREKIYRRAQELGLGLCPAEVGPQLRLQYNDQPSFEWLFIGMDPVTDSNRNLRMFFVERDGFTLWLSANSGDADRFWNGGFRWVFVLPRPVK